MNRHVKKVFATLTTAALLSTTPVLASAESQVKEPNRVKITKGQQNEASERGNSKQDSKVKKKVAQEKAVSKRLEDLEHRLGQITVHNKKISDRMEEFFDGAKEEQEESVTDEEEQEEPVADEEEQEEPATDEEEKQEEPVADEEEEQEEPVADEEEEQEEPATNEEEEQEEPVTDEEEEQEEPVTNEEEGQEEPATDEEEEQEEVVTDEKEQEEEEELENYDDQADSFSGKLQAQHNKLDAVERYIDHLSEWLEKRLGLNHSYTDQLEELYTELEKLRQTVNGLEEDLENKEKEVTKKVKGEEKEYFGSKENINSDKVWNINFNADLSEQAIDQLNFIVFDEEMKVVPVQVSYDKVRQSVSLAPEKSYNSGETYTLFIAKDIESEKGIGLKQAVQMSFTIE
ncbi:hypothetical protein IMZ31_14885 [Pontibacillus sp. ALD_SL1]|uniref:Ig-like domain-containing protein n=1 Tax=Pontibacillus sp. ALD_SL1 TaxID=2777185 RepID=UPI001A9739C8|nr:hypothetical protein [Pontibacillus sp. ALD_SL1]QSS99353.1 hypothetical protein IMZ31_14885 [Pontibacillus sp. ALD_SL1]